MERLHGARNDAAQEMERKNDRLRSQLPNPFVTPWCNLAATLLRPRPASECESGRIVVV